MQVVAQLFPVGVQMIANKATIAGFILLMLDGHWKPFVAGYLQLELGNYRMFNYLNERRQTKNNGRWMLLACALLTAYSHNARLVMVQLQGTPLIA